MNLKKLLHFSNLDKVWKEFRDTLPIKKWDRYKTGIDAECYYVAIKCTVQEMKFSFLKTLQPIWVNP